MQKGLDFENLDFEVIAPDEFHERVMIRDWNETYNISSRNLETLFLQNLREIRTFIKNHDVEVSFPKEIEGNLNDGHRPYFLLGVKYLLEKTDRLECYKER